MNPALDLFFDDFTLDEFAEFVSQGRSSCAFCKWVEYCDHMMAMDDSNYEKKYPYGNGVHCKDVVKSVLEKEMNK